MLTFQNVGAADISKIQLNIRCDWDEENLPDSLHCTTMVFASSK